jgi:cell division septum initiation protein DivIVA
MTGDSAEDVAGIIQKLEAEIEQLTDDIKGIDQEIESLNGQLREISDGPTYLIYPRKREPRPDIVQAIDQILAVIHGQ